jgi:hypothetical protein
MDLKENLISAKLIGGLGNQLFAAANAIAQGLKHNRKVVFLPQSHTPGQGNGAENYLNNVFRNLKFVDSLENFKIKQENSFNYSGVNPHQTNTIFTGYYQSTKNWFGFENEIRNIFLPPKDLVDFFHKKYPELGQENTLSLHVRRSEYLVYPRIHPTISKEYINKALEIIGNYSSVFVFSDDHDWVNQHLNLKNKILVNEQYDWQELYLMGLCKNHIMSNSTFSWWGTFLNENKNKKIIVPSVWFGPDGPNGSDIYEDYWSLIPCKWIDGGSIVPLDK